MAASVTHQCFEVEGKSSYGTCSSEIIAMKLTSDEECDGLKWS